MRRCFAAVQVVLEVLGVSARAEAQSPPAAPTSLAVGDWLLSPQLELRTRGEYRRDAPELVGVARDSYGVLERTRIGLGAEYGATRSDPGFLRAQVTLQDARAWGVPNPTGILGAEGSSPSSVGVYEAWVEARTSAARPAYLRIGRQAITWGDGRLVSNADWSPVARTLDAVRGHASAGLFDFDLFAAILDAPTPLGPGIVSSASPASPGTELYGAQVGALIAPLLKLELSLLAKEHQPSGFDTAFGAPETYAASLRVFGAASGWRYAAEGVYELARQSSSSLPKNDSTIAGAAYVEKKLDGVVLSPMLRLEGDYASGPQNGGQAFDPILPDVHELHGAMDLFAWSNTVEASARVTVSPWTDGRIGVEYRYARLASASGTWVDGYLNPVTYASPTSTSLELGHEVDAWTSWRPWPALDLVGGYSVFAAGDAARGAVPAGVTSPLDRSASVASLSHFAYLQATLRVP